MRAGLVYRLAIGERIRCEGIQKDLKFKASTISIVDGGVSVLTRCYTGETQRDSLGLVADSLNGATEPALAQPAERSKVKILVCQKSHCFNNGGKEIYSALTAQLKDCNLDDRVNVKLTGCLKCCKKGPNMVVLPDRASYHNVKASQIPAIVAKVEHRLTIE